MGIPIGWNIKREEAKDKDVLRADISGQRSPIRRRARPSRSSRSIGAFDPEFILANAHSSRSENIARSAHARARLAPPPVPELSRASADASLDSATENARPQRRLSRRPVDANGYSFGWTVEEQTGSEDERPFPALTPGFAPAYPERFADAHVESRRQGLSEHFGLGPIPRLTRSRSPTRIERYRSARTGYSLDSAEEDLESSENNAVSFPPLRRMGRRTIADGPLPSSSLRESWSSLSTVNGLGDRERSVSPSAWDTFDTTIVPDPVAPTAESSFASAAASASFSNSHPSSRAGSSNSAASSRTHLTVPSRRGSRSQNEQFMRACDTSDDDSASDTEEEEIDVRGSIRLSNATEAARNRSGLHISEPLRRRMRPSYFSSEPPARDSGRYSHRVLEQSRDARAYVHGTYGSFALSRDDADVERPLLSQLDGPIEEPGTSEEEIPALVSIQSLPMDQELRDARSLLERLSRDPDIGDDFWASVGLTRSFADPVERFQEREGS